MPPFRRAAAVLLLALTGIAAPAHAAPSTPPSTAGGASAVIYFDAGSSRLLPSAQRTLARVATDLSAEASLRITGYVQASGTSANNLSLGLARAAAVRQFLVGHGVRSAISIHSAGIRAGLATTARARAATLSWTTPQQPTTPATPATDTSSVTPPSPSTPDTSTPAPAGTDTTTATPPAPATCTVVFDSQASMPAEVASAAVAPGASVTLPRVPYGPGSFGGWFTDANNAKTRAQDPSAFVGFATQQVAATCAAGGTLTLFAHWVVDVVPVTTRGQLHVTATVLAKDTVTVSDCASGCPVSKTGAATAYSFETMTAGSGGSITVSLKKFLRSTSWTITYGGGTSESVYSTTAVGSRTFTVTNGTFTRTIASDGSITIVWTPTSGRSGTDSLSVSAVDNT